MDVAIEPLPFTGERFVPGLKGEIAYEHVHRYLACRPLVRGLRVLDVACGEGYGAEILAKSATEVIGVDINEMVCRRAQRLYGGGNRRFAAANLHALPFPDACFDAVVSFETIEHVDSQDRALVELRRVMAPQAVLVISTPDAERGGGEESNPFHVRELTLPSFHSMLKGVFGQVRLYGQRTMLVSTIQRMDSGSRRAEVISPDSVHGVFEGMPNPVFGIAVCTAEGAALPKLAPSMFYDPGDDVLATIREGLLWAANVERGVLEMKDANERSRRELAVLREQLQAARQVAVEQTGELRAAAAMMQSMVERWSMLP